MANVLVIDSDPEMRALMRAALESAGHAVREACDGNEGLREFRRLPADLVVCDMFTPDREGQETMIELCGIDLGVRILAVTRGTPHLPPRLLLAAARALGASDVLVKPFTAAEFLSAVAGLSC